MTDNINGMDEQKYLTERVDDQINWMEGKAAYNQKRFKRIRIIELVCSASIPFLAAVSTDSTYYFRWITGIFGVSITICESLLALYKHQELWLQYRSTAEALRSEKLLYLLKSGKYEKVETPFALFVSEIESILGNENTHWKKHIAKAKLPKT